MGAYMFDIIIVILLVVFAWRGAAKGLFLSFCGLAVVFVAFFAAQFVSSTFCGPVGGIIRPVIAQSIRDALPEPTPTAPNPANPEEEEQPVFTMDQVAAAIRENELFQGLSDFLEQGIANDAVGRGVPDPVDALAGYLARGIAKVLLFALVFIGGQLAWFLLTHAMDLAFKLPILAQVNLAAGLVIGLVKGVLLVIVLVWLGQAAGLIPNPPETPVVSLFTVEQLWALLSAAAA